jgi:hypothetical protein
VGVVPGVGAGAAGVGVAPVSAWAHAVSALNPALASEEMASTEISIVEAR